MFEQRPLVKKQGKNIFRLAWALLWWVVGVNLRPLDAVTAIYVLSWAPRAAKDVARFGSCCIRYLYSNLLNKIESMLFIFC